MGSTGKGGTPKRKRVDGSDSEPESSQQRDLVDSVSMLEQQVRNLLSAQEAQQGELASLRKDHTSAVAALQQQHEEVLAALKAENERLKEENARLKALLEASNNPLRGNPIVASADGHAGSAAPPGPAGPRTYAQATAADRQRVADSARSLHNIRGEREAATFADAALRLRRPARPVRPAPAAAPSGRFDTPFVLVYAGILKQKIGDIKKLLGPEGLKARTSCIYGYRFVGGSVTELLVQASYADELKERLAAAEIEVLDERAFQPGAPGNPRHNTIVDTLRKSLESQIAFHESATRKDADGNTVPVTRTAEQTARAQAAAQFYRRWLAELPAPMAQ